MCEHALTLPLRKPPVPALPPAPPRPPTPTPRRLSPPPRDASYAHDAGGAGGEDERKSAVRLKEVSITDPLFVEAPLSPFGGAAGEECAADFARKCAGAASTAMPPRIAAEARSATAPVPLALGWPVSGQCSVAAEQAASRAGPGALQLSAELDLVGVAARQRARASSRALLLLLLPRGDLVAPDEGGAAAHGAAASAGRPCAGVA